MNAGRELDRLVAEKVMGWTDVRIIASGEGAYPVGHHPERGSGVVPLYSTDIAAAWKIVDAMRQRGYRCTIEDYGTRWQVRMVNAAVYGAMISGTTPPHAICLAALEAVGQGAHER